MKPLDYAEILDPRLGWIILDRARNRVYQAATESDAIAMVEDKHPHLHPRRDRGRSVARVGHPGDGGCPRPSGLRRWMPNGASSPTDVPKPSGAWWSRRSLTTPTPNKKPAGWTGGAWRHEVGKTLVLAPGQQLDAPQPIVVTLDLL
jgi:hypothetical protein